MKTRLGILGGGQLGKMLMEAGSRLNIDYHFLEKDANCPARLVSSNQIIGSLYDEKAILELSKSSDVLTYEIEHVNVNVLEQLEAEGKTVLPKPSVLKVIQDKGAQKEFFKSQNVSTLPYALETSAGLSASIAQWPDERFVLKHRKGGYDGKGVSVLSKTDFTKMVHEQSDLLTSEDGYVIEKIIENPVELSVIVGVDQMGNSASYEVSEMIFDDQSNLMDYLITPSNQTVAIENQAKELAESVVLGFNSPGLFAVELFMDKMGDLYVNEIAPRPHNSGHHTIESAYCSQYEQLNRILTGLPIGSTEQITAALTCNIVGSQGITGTYEFEGVEEIMKLKGIYLHLYGKNQTKPFRKLGHFTVIGNDKNECLDIMHQVKAMLTLKSV